MMELTDNDTKQMNDMENFLSWRSSWIFRQFLHCKHRIIALFTGNQYGKTAGVAYGYVLRIMGLHPIPQKNVLYFECASRYCSNGHQHTAMPKDRLCGDCGEEVDEFSAHAYSIKTRPENNVCTECGERVTIHERKTRIYRFCAENLPNEKGYMGDANESAETKNTTYPAFKKWLPAYLLKKDITARNPSMTMIDPNGGMIFGEKADGTPMEYAGGDIIVEFVSYNQSTQATAGVQRLSIWEDEEAPLDFHGEQLPRLIAENGDLLISLTPCNYITWTYDEIFEKAKVYYRSKKICDFLSTEGDRVEQVQHVDSQKNIAVIMASAYDNPTLSKNVIDELLGDIDDPDVRAIKLYGIFRQVSGRIFKDFDFPTHVIDNEKYFPDGVPHGWVHARGIDFHPQTPWANGFIALSPEDEAFIYADMNISPEKFTTREISRENAIMGKDYKFTLNLVDPLAAATQKDTVTVLDDINREFYELKREGIGAGGYWQTWDTKGEKGRDEIRMRLKNAKRVGVPFNNTVLEHGREKRLPTLWILDTCRASAQWMKQWRWEEWAHARDRSIKEQKNVPQQKFSHLNMVWEAIFKHSAFKPRVEAYRAGGRAPQYFQGRRT